MNPLSIITLLTGITFILLGLAFRVFPPGKINPLYGYRTSSSMRNPETWKAANQFAAKLMLQTGLLLAGVGVVTFILPPSPVTGLVAGIGLLVLTVFMQIYFTEKHLKKHFDEKGNRRN